MAKLDTQTAELPGLPPLPKKRGRPSTGNALTNAERQARYRASRNENARVGPLGDGSRDIERDFVCIEANLRQLLEHYTKMVPVDDVITDEFGVPSQKWRGVSKKHVVIPNGWEAEHMAYKARTALGELLAMRKSLGL
jgi:hypothetical protein